MERLTISPLGSINITESSLRKREGRMLTEVQAKQLKSSGRRVTWKQRGKQYRGTLGTITSTRALVRGKSGTEEFQGWVLLRDLSSQ